MFMSIFHGGKLVVTQLSDADILEDLIVHQRGVVGLLVGVAAVVFGGGVHVDMITGFLAQANSILQRNANTLFVVTELTVS